MEFDEDAMMERLDAGYEPIDVAIEKWKALKAEWIDMTGGEHGDSCALCQVHIGKGCVGCPLQEIGYKCDVDGSPFRRALARQNATTMLKALYKAKKWVEEQKCKEKGVGKGRPKLKEPKVYRPKAGDEVNIEIRKPDQYFNEPEREYLEEQTYIIDSVDDKPRSDGTYGCYLHPKDRTCFYSVKLTKA